MASIDDWPGFFTDMNSKLRRTIWRTARRWLKDRLLGSHLLISGQKEAFLGWANRVEHLLEEDGGRVPDLQRVQRFYAILRNLSAPSTPRWHHDAIASVRRLVERLDPELGQSDVRKAPEFEDLLDVSKMTRLLSREPIDGSLADIIEGFLLLRTKRHDVRLKGPLPNARLSEREGTYQLLLSEAILLLDCDAVLLPGEVVDLSVSHDLEQALLEIELEMPDDGTMPSDVQERIENRPVWQLLRLLARVLWIRVSARSLRICCGLQKNR